MNGLELKIRRIRAGLTQYDLAQEASIHPSRLSEMEIGKRPVAEAVTDVLDKEPSVVPGSGRSP